MTYNFRIPGAWRAARLGLATGLLALPLAGCSVDEILEVEDPDVIEEDVLSDATSVPAIHASVISNFADAYDGYNGQILYSGLLADEFYASGTFPTRREIDARDITLDNGTLQDATRELYRAIRAGEVGADRLAELGASSAMVAEALNLAGYAYILFAENYCSGIPFSQLGEGNQFTFGEANTTEEVLENFAIAKFDEVLGMTDAGATMLNMARLGKARALVNLGRFQEAAEIASEVPTDFIYIIEHSTNTAAEYNGVYEMVWNEGRMSLVDEEGGNGLPYLSAWEAGDPRTPWVRLSGRNAFGFSSSAPAWRTLLYEDFDAPTTVAWGVEARLIEAEAALWAGDEEAFLNLLNEPREDVAYLMSLREPVIGVVLGVTPELDPIEELPATQAEQVDLLFQERAYWMYLTSHRLGDLRRLVRQYDRPVESVFPTGEYFWGGFYGEDVTLRLPIDEENNTMYNDVAAQCVSTVA